MQVVPFVIAAKANSHNTPMLVRIITLSCWTFDHSVGIVLPWGFKIFLIILVSLETGSVQT